MRTKTDVNMKEIIAPGFMFLLGLKVSGMWESFLFSDSRYF